MGWRDHKISTGWIHCNRESAIKLICCRPQLMPRSWLVICGKPRLSVCQIYKRQWWWMQRGYTISAQGIGGSYTGWYNNIQPATTGWSSKANDGWPNKKTKVDMASDIQAALSQMEEKLCISSGQFHILYMNQPRHTPPVRQRGHWNRNFSPLKFRLHCLTYNLPITAVIVVFVFVSLCSSFDASLSPDLITECSFSSLIVQFYPSFDAESANKSREDSVHQHSSMHRCIYYSIWYK